MIVGIFGRPALTDLDNKGVLIYKNLCEKLYSYNCFPIGLVPNIKGMNFNQEITDKEYNQLKRLINICDGIIMQGGEEMNEYDVTVAKYLYEEDIPCMGICLGMQTMAKALNGSITHVPGHNTNEDHAHYIKIDKTSKLYEIINKEYIYVNSRHNDKVQNTKLAKGAYYEDVIEEVEDKTKKFYLGVQWHPELLNDENSDKIFKAFINSLKK